MGPVMRRRLRTQVQAGQSLLALALLLSLPMAHPLLWPLQIWGEFSVPVFVWPLVFLAVSLTLLRTRRVRTAMLGMMGAALLLLIVAAAAYLSVGWNALTILAGVKMLHCIWTAIDLKELTRATDGRA